MNPNRQIKFTRSLKGYDPQEVDSVLEEMQREIDGLREQNRAMKSTVEQYDKKMEQLNERTNRLEEERISESLRISGIMSNIAKMSQEAESDAKRKAEEIIKSAYTEVGRIFDKARQDSVSMRETLKNMRSGIRNVHQSSDRCFNDLETISSKLLYEISSIPEVPANPLRSDLLKSDSLNSVTPQKYGGADGFNDGAVHSEKTEE